MLPSDLLNPVLSKDIYASRLLYTFTCMTSSRTASAWRFLEGRSTVITLLKCTDDWFRILESGYEGCAVFFDFLTLYPTKSFSKSYQQLVLMTAFLTGSITTSVTGHKVLWWRVHTLMWHLYSHVFLKAQYLGCSCSSLTSMT